MSPDNPLSVPHCVVRAAAGTGKTWLLTSRIVRLLHHGVPAGAILAVTFTQKAAKEIQGRLLEKLRALAFADDTTLTCLLQEIGLAGDPAGRERARRLYEEFLTTEHPLRASTFHAFCQDLLRRFPLEAGIVPGFDLLEDTTDLQREAWAALDREARTTPEVAAALEALLEATGGLANTKQALNEFLAHRSDWWAYTENARQPVPFACTHLDSMLHVPPQDALTDPGIDRRLRQYCELLKQHATATHLDYVDRLARGTGTGPEEKRSLMTPVFLKSDGSPREPSKKLRSILGQKAIEFDQLHEQLLLALKESQDQARKLSILDTSKSWYLCGERLLHHYQRLKQDNNVLDFADLEWKTYELLNHSRHAEWIQFKLDQRIDHLLVDEFQDTNPTQWRLLLPLLEEIAAGDEDRARSVFLVGDEKQSIYRFRRAQPALFRAAGEWLAERVQAKTTRQARSYRSSPAITSFVNLVFDRDGASPLPDFQTHDTHRGELCGRAELLPLIPDLPAIPPKKSGLRDPLQQPRVVQLDSRYEREGERLAQTIRDAVRDIIVDSGKDARPCRFGDILVLVRERTQAHYFEEALRRAHIPHTSVARTRLIDCLEVRDLLHLMQLFLDPEDDLALASVLKSPIFSASDDDLIALARVAGTQRQQWLRCLRGLAPHLESTALGHAQRLLGSWCARADRIPAHDLLDAIYNEGNVIERYESAAPPHLRSRVRANLTKLLDLALETDGGRFPSLSRFLAQLRAGNQESAAGVAAEEDDRVRVMTVHGAKGLEAPVVFLVDAARPPKAERGVRALIEWPAEAARPTHFYLVGKKNDLDEVTRTLVARQEAAAQQEEHNLLYVALTRAKQYLFVSGCAPRQNRGRHWYGQIEARLQATQAAAGLVVHTDTDAAGEPYNTYGTLAYGEAPAPAPRPAPAHTPAAAEVDVALTRPLASPMGDGMLRPSEADAADEDHPGTEAGARRRLRGTAIHRALQLLTSTPDRARARRQFDAQFRPALGPPLLDACWSEALGVIDAPHLRTLFDPALHLRAENELQLLYQDGGQEVFGVIDRLVFTATGLILIDYKTHPGVKRDELSALAAHYSAQMRLYARGVARLWPAQPIRTVVLFTALPDVVDVAT